MRCMRVSLKSCALNWFSPSTFLPPFLPSCCTTLQLIFMPCTCAQDRQVFACVCVCACPSVIYCLHLLFHMWKLQLQLPKLQSKSKSRSFDAPNERHSTINTCRQHLGTNWKREREGDDPLHTAADPCHNTVVHMTHVSICLIASKHTHVNVYFDFHFLTRQTNLDSCTWHMICICICLCIGNGNGSNTTPIYVLYVLFACGSLLILQSGEFIQQF